MLQMADETLGLGV